ncbi:hypothetical protein [Burkholderia sp. BE12]|uniref:hypothetical protein n=1 Tax=Burkholderia sp. BE12 TaxID=2082394 RepID=UPI001319C892|nr:hypothetical protein [Burkholderia sp. BE12]
MDRDQMVATLALMGWTPIRRQVGDMGQLVHFGVKAPDCGGYIQSWSGVIPDRMAGIIMGDEPHMWRPCAWDEMRFNVLHALFLQVYNHER